MFVVVVLLKYMMSMNVDISFYYYYYSSSSSVVVVVVVASETITGVMLVTTPYFRVETRPPRSRVS